MFRQKHKDFKLFRFTIWHFIVPQIIGAIILFIEEPSGFRNFNAIRYVVLYAFSVSIPFIKGNEYFTYLYDKYYPWLKNPFKRLLFSVSSDIIMMIIIIFAVNLIYHMIIFHHSFQEVITVTFYGFRFAIVFLSLGLLIFNVFFFFKNWKESTINEEKLKQEKLMFEYEALKNQVNPHFLFNSLTTLSSLVYENQEKAVTFIRKFSDVYRYVLEYQGKEIADLSTEKKLLESFSYLYKIRHEDHVFIDIDLPDSTEIFVIPMVLQMLLENAVKHNSSSKDSPLKISIRINNDYIEVKNNIQPRSVIVESNEIGLKNIILQYKYLTDKEIIIEDNNENYIVKIPVLTKTT